MARQILRLVARIDPEDRAGFERDVEAIMHKYGDQPHTRARRDAELQQACETLGRCVQVKIESPNG